MVWSSLSSLGALLMPFAMMREGQMNRKAQQSMYDQQRRDQELAMQEQKVLREINKKKKSEYNKQDIALKQQLQEFLERLNLQRSVAEDDIHNQYYGIGPKHLKAGEEGPLNKPENPEDPWETRMLAPGKEGVLKGYKDNMYSYFSEPEAYKEELKNKMKGTEYEKRAKEEMMGAENAIRTDARAKGYNEGSVLDNAINRAHDRIADDAIWGFNNFDKQNKAESLNFIMNEMGDKYDKVGNQYAQAYDKQRNQYEMELEKLANSLGLDVDDLQSELAASDRQLNANLMNSQNQFESRRAKNQGQTQALQMMMALSGMQSPEQQQQQNMNDLISTYKLSNLAKDDPEWAKSIPTFNDTLKHFSRKTPYRKGYLMDLLSSRGGSDNNSSYNSFNK